MTFFIHASNQHGQGHSLDLEGSLLFVFPILVGWSVFCLKKRISWVRDGMFDGTLQEWAYFPTCVSFEPELRNKNWIAAIGGIQIYCIVKSRCQRCVSLASGSNQAGYGRIHSVSTPRNDWIIAIYPLVI